MPGQLTDPELKLSSNNIIFLIQISQCPQEKGVENDDYSYCLLLVNNETLLCYSKPSIVPALSPSSLQK